MQDFCLGYLLHWGFNVLILDEPTNHLDMEGVAALKELLKEYKGAVVLVSHNRWFFGRFKYRCIL